MAKIPQFTRQLTSSGQTGETFISPSAADVGAGIEQRAQQELGQEVTQLGFVRDKILRAEGASQAGTARRRANAEIQALELRLADDADVRGYQDKLDETIAGMEDFTPSNQFGAAEYSIWLQGQVPAWQVGVSGLAVKKTQDIAEGALITNSAAAIASENEPEALRLNDEALATGIITPKVHAQRELDIPNQIATTSITKSLNFASESMTEGKFSNAELHLAAAEAKLDSSQVDADTERLMRSRIKSMTAEMERNENQADAEAVKAEEDRLFKGLDDGSMTTNDIVNSKVLPVAAKRRLLDDENQFIKMDLAQSWPLVDDDDAVQELNTILANQTSGVLDINEVNKKINDAAASGRLTKASRDSFRDKANKGGLDAIDDSVNNFTLRVKNSLTGRLTERQARLTARAAARDLTRDEQREAASVEFMRQVGFEQLNLYSAELNSRMRETGKEVLSGVEAEALAAQVWEKYKNKTDAQRIREFKDFSGRQVPRPDGFPVDVWESISLEERAEVVSGLSKGGSVQQALDMVAR
jgi:hypothetical protein